MTISSHVISERRLVGLSSLVSIHVHVFNKSPNLHGNLCKRATSYLIITAEDLIVLKIVKSVNLILTVKELIFGFH
jgi:hypothetical protein